MHFLSCGNSPANNHLYLVPQIRPDDDLRLYDELYADGDEGYEPAGATNDMGSMDLPTQLPQDQVFRLSDRFAAAEDVQSEACSSVDETQDTPLLCISADVHRDRSLSTCLQSHSANTTVSANNTVRT